MYPFLSSVQLLPKFVGRFVKDMIVKRLLPHTAVPLKMFRKFG